MGGLRFKHLFRGSFVESEGTFQVVVIVFLLSPCSLAVDYRAAPLMPNETFLWVWNVPAEPCIGNFNYSLDMSFFSLVGSPRKSATGQAVTIFYTDRLGKYPHMDEKQKEVFGGIPQAGNLQEHLNKAKTDIEHYIPVDQLGLAVIDWEEWRPTWERNWKPKDIYKNKSIELVQTQNSGMNIAQATVKAKEQFESAGRKYMEETLKLGKKLRPQYFWGFFLFPDCYNYQNYLDPGYKGKCPKIEIDRNNNLGWIWKESTALYPATYLKRELKSSPNAKLFNRYRVVESIRISKVHEENNPLPVFLYTRVVFSDRIWEFLSLNDLVNTIGEAVALGTSGVVIWDSISIAQRVQTACPVLHQYVSSILYPYIINVTLAAKMCSQTLCNHQGICTRKDENSNHYIQLNPENLEIILKNRKFEVVGNPTVGDLKYFSEHFKCTCYTKMGCKERPDIESVTNVNVCTRNNICLNTHVDPGRAFYLLPGKNLLFFITVAHILYHLL
uniref:hyaluronidase PH-20-like n=1 Tax=Myodes glareolus TaxID=447135 RepID=UPI00202277D2|nr:hyaluronidase PH-20-like [Myodes glareolus]XP_048306898.1 hyaluronidase PH-20-like [Myodes glareolus]